MQCEIESCNNDLTAKSAKGLCPAHYSRFIKQGKDFSRAPIGARANKSLSSKNSPENVPAHRKWCYGCETVKDLTDFKELSLSTKRSHPNLTHNAQCSECHSAMRRGTISKRNFGERGWEIHLRRESGEGCVICGSRLGKLAIDHSHKCCASLPTCGECVRDLLCPNCNTALGLLKEDRQRIRALADYVEKWNNKLFGGD